MTEDWGITLLWILFLLIVSGFFSGSETALTAASKNRLSQWAKDGNRSAQMVLDLLDDKQRLIGAILLGNNLANILASSLAAALLLSIFGDEGVFYATLVMTASIVIFAEVMPKIYAIANADKMSLWVVWPIRIIVFIFGPITLLVQKIVGSIFNALGVDVSDKIDAQSREDELRGAIEQHDDTTDPDTRSERLMMRSILELDDVQVSEIMTHRSNVSMVDLDDDLDINLEKILDGQFSRMPLYKDDDTAILGVIHIRQLVSHIRNQELSRVTLEDVASDPWFIPDTTTLLEQLQAFRERREHFALVVDEYGDFQGVVTLEDILEEIVGEIDDETDTVMVDLKGQPDGSYVVNGTTTLRDLNRELDWNLPDDEAVTIAGLVLYESGRIPHVGEVYTFYDYRFEVMRRHNNQIVQLRVYPPSAKKQMAE